MPAEDFEKEAARLYEQVKPLYQGLHCYARGRLQQKYGKDKVPDGKPIPAQLVRQHVGAAVEPRLRRPAQALPGAPASNPPTASCRRRSGTRCA